MKFQTVRIKYNLCANICEEISYFLCCHIVIKMYVMNVIKDYYYYYYCKYYLIQLIEFIYDNNKRCNTSILDFLKFMRNKFMHRM